MGFRSLVLLVLLCVPQVRGAQAPPKAASFTTPYTLAEMEGNLARRADRAAARANYVQALAVVEYLFERSGEGAVACLVRDLGEGQTFSEALRGETGLTPDELFRKWKEWARL